MDTENNKQSPTPTVHTSVLLQDVITTLSLTPTDVVVDGTLGGGGHAKKILELLGDEGRYIGIDADKHALERVRELLVGDERIYYVQGNFRNIDAHVHEAGYEKVDKILLDLGLSSDQLDQKGGRGFSFQREEPLGMTFASEPKEGELTAWHIVNEWSEETLADIIYGFGGEHRSRKIAHAIVTAREEHSIDTTTQLADIVQAVSSGRKGVHPATKTFQAIRMAANDELGALHEVLEKSRDLLNPKGRIAVISFHSLEDRSVKQMFAAWEKEGIGKRVTKKPIAPTREECKANRRARSAKLRCFEME